MPEFTALELAVLASVLVAGMGIGWLLRSDRCAREKIAVNAGWQEQLESRQAENERLEERIRGLERQLADSGSGGDRAARAGELDASLAMAVARRDELERKLEEAESALDAATAERERLAALLESTRVEGAELRKRDEKISRLKRQLASWRALLPPLIARYRERNSEAQRLQSELDLAIRRIARLEAITRPDDTHLEAIDPGALERLAASNEPHAAAMDADARQAGDDPEID